MQLFVVGLYNSTVCRGYFTGICYMIPIEFIAASWSSGRVQDSGLGSRSSPGFNTLLVRLLVVPLSKALHAALLLSTQEEMGTCEVIFVSRGAKLRVSGCILPGEFRWLSRRIWTVKGPMTREGTCQSLQSRALSLDVDTKQWLYFYLYHCIHCSAWDAIVRLCPGFSGGFDEPLITLGHGRLITINAAYDYLSMLKINTHSKRGTRALLLKWIDFNLNMDN